MEKKKKRKEKTKGQFLEVSEGNQDYTKNSKGTYMLHVGNYSDFVLSVF